MIFILKKQEGFTLIELLIVIAVIGILAATAIPGYLGIQERGRRGAVNSVCNSTIPELQGWINTVKKANTPLGTLIEIDTNGNGVIAPPDLNNDNLAINGIITTFVAAKVTAISPWDNSAPLWVNGGAAPSQAACNAIAEASTGQITLCYNPDDDQSVRVVFLSATNDSGTVFYQKAISAD